MTCWLATELILVRQVVAIGMAASCGESLCLVLGTEADVDKRDGRP